MFFCIFILLFTVGVFIHAAWITTWLSQVWLHPAHGRLSYSCTGTI